MHGNISVIKALLDAGANLKGSLALTFAAGEGHRDAMAYLLSRGAHIDEVPNPELVTPRHHEAGLRNALCEAAAKGQAAAVKFLLERGADIDMKSSTGQSALELAEEAGREDCVVVLKEYGAGLAEDAQTGRTRGLEIDTAP